MATKKQKRERALAKRAQFLKEKELEDLEFQRRGHEEDRRESQRIQAIADKYNNRIKNALQNYREEHQGMRPCEHNADGPHPRNSNICVAEGCFNEECLKIQKESTTDE